MTREPDPFAECHVGGLCTTCNAPTHYCDACDDVEVEKRGDLCDACEAKACEEQFQECDWCGADTDGRFCSRSCRLASESDRA